MESIVVVLTLPHIVITFVKVSPETPPELTILDEIELNLKISL